MFADPNVDLVLCTLLAPGNADFAEFGELMKRLRRSTTSRSRCASMAGKRRQRWTAGPRGADVPVFKTTRAAVRALALMVQATM